MHEQLCPFERVILSTEFSCTESQKYFYAHKEGIKCNNHPARLNCKLLVEHLRQNSQFALKQPIAADGKLTHGQEMKIKCGGLQGIQALHNGGDDIHSLLNQAIEQYQDLGKLPWTEIMPAVQAYRVRAGKTTR